MTRFTRPSTRALHVNIYGVKIYLFFEVCRLAVAGSKQGLLVIQQETFIGGVGGGKIGHAISILLHFLVRSSSSERSCLTIATM